MLGDVRPSPGLTASSEIGCVRSRHRHPDGPTRSGRRHPRARGQPGPDRRGGTSSRRAAYEPSRRTEGVDLRLAYRVSADFRVRPRARRHRIDAGETLRGTPAAWRQAILSRPIVTPSRTSTSSSGTRRRPGEGSAPPIASTLVSRSSPNRSRAPLVEARRAAHSPPVSAGDPPMRRTAHREREHAR